MSVLVILNLGNGNLSVGFPSVIVQLSTTSTSVVDKFKGSLPAAPELIEAYKKWNFLYQELSQRLRSRSALEIENEDITNVSVEAFKELCEQLETLLNSWLNSKEFHELERQLRTELDKKAEIRFLIEVDDDLTQRLPWHSWNFFKAYSKAEVALSSAENRLIPQQYRVDGQINILAILGNSQGIDVQKDRETLENLQGAKSEFLVEPKRKSLNDHLWEKSWDILFFAGHSQTEGETGRIYINKTDSLTIKDLKYALQKAVERGLKLAIFNSCDGLGLAHALGDLHIPQIIVMREPVPDLVAQEFLKYFLQEFADGKPLYLAVRSVRERLQGLEDEFPAASWLPIICQHPASVPPTWQQLRDGIESDRTDSTMPQSTTHDRSDHAIPPTSHPAIAILRHPAFVAGIASIAIASLVLGVRQMGWLQTWELQAYDQTIRLRPDEGPDPRLLIVTIDEADLQYQDRMGMERRGSLADAALNQLLKKLEPHQPRVIGLDIYRDFPVRRDQTELVNQLKQNNNFIAVCKHSDPEANDPGIKPPDEVPEDRVSFSDVVVDYDSVIRRHLWSLNANINSPCTTEVAFSLQLALHYLAAQGIKPKAIPEKRSLQLGNILLKPLETHFGGYRNLDDRGYQMLLNYRSRQVAERVSLTDVLSGKFNPNLVRNRIVIIGIIAPSVKDDYYTPYSIGRQRNQKMRGVFVQAQMTSQIIGAVLDKRPLLGVLPAWGDTLWIWGWSLVGGIIAWRIRKTLNLGLVFVVAVVTLSGICFILFINGTWMPLVPSLLALILTTGASSAAYSQFRFWCSPNKLPPSSL
ncbi:hypothetical protein BCD67_21815 [Oscillatoriales cyanobacterium USR001]|nr:hypothetical protein BCD67_21815 [Oscillatoriales cyanobacterium USR001]